ncbi:DUF2946 domain-containing protein [Halomonas denitrificans]|uniref:DUF2946 domain-containing protein n=1 Tax=Halomonas denitrificans TaxID=370769 RepID=UPI001C98EC89|nr:DUF2946 domain-containing protein [Halomonas denitrificans]MBY5968662.1 DUF2946 domain-containing protein [Halomonas denitrificans]
MSSTPHRLRLSPRFQRRVCLLAVAAMLMLFVGPLASQLQRLLEPPAVSLHHHHHAHGGALTSDETAVQTESTSLDAGHHHLAACGYCVLFAQVPALSMIAVTALAGAAPRAPPGPSTLRVFLPLLQRFTLPTPRAPPGRSVR